MRAPVTGDTIVRAIMGPMSGASLFDRVVMVDWSANSTPKRGRDSIWIGDSRSHEAVNPSTRSAAMALIRAVCAESIDERVLIGFDFSFGYPAGFARALTGSSAWSSLWSWMAEHIADDDRNRNDRLDVAARVNDRLRSTGWGSPFWGYPGATRGDGLERSRPSTYAPFDAFRIAEHRVRAAGHRPFSAWQLAYPGSVGSQMMLGIRALELLRRDPSVSHRLRLWPYETGLGSDSGVIERGEVLLAEIWPSMFPLDVNLHPVRDAAQVLTMVRHITATDSAGALHRWFDPALTGDERALVVAEEGWTLGVV